MTTKKISSAKRTFLKALSSARMQEHREAKDVLKKLGDNKHIYSTIYYSCQDTGLLPRITSIAVCDVSTWQSKSFSIHISAELLRITPADIPEHYDKIEGEMLRDYFEYLRTSEKIIFVHWDSGFQAIEQRGELLCPDAVYKLIDERKIDLSQLFVKFYGQKYIGHPQFKSLVELNYPLSRNFMDEKEEEIAFKNGDYVKLHQSTSVKVTSIPKLLGFAIDGDLKTNATWRSTYGLSVDGIIAAVRSKWYFSLIVWLVSVLLAAFVANLILGRLES